MMCENIQPESLDECTASGHPYQAWMMLIEEQQQGEFCSTCGKVPQFRDKTNIEDMILPFDYVAEVIFLEQGEDDGPVCTFKLLTDVVPLPNSGHEFYDHRLEAIRLAYGGKADRCRRCLWILVGDYGLNEDGHCAHCVTGIQRDPEFQFPPQE
jgi:hypothetical protein